MVILLVLVELRGPTYQSNLLKDTVCFLSDSSFIAHRLGIEVSIRLPELEIRGDTELDVLFVTYKSQLVAVSNDMTVKMRVAIYRQLNENVTNVNVSFEKKRLE